MSEMHSGATPPDLTVSIRVRHPIGDVWAAVADPRRIASWSPEARSTSGASSGPLPVGSIFHGSNQHGLFRWSTKCVVVESSPGAAFAFDVTFLGLAVARWRYELSVDGDRTLVEEQWSDSRGLAMRAIGAVGTGVPDRRTHNERTMRETLDAMRADLESKET